MTPLPKTPAATHKHPHGCDISNCHTRDNSTLLLWNAVKHTTHRPVVTHCDMRQTHTQTHNLRSLISDLHVFDCTRQRACSSSILSRAAACCRDLALLRGGPPAAGPAAGAPSLDAPHISTGAITHARQIVRVHVHVCGPALGIDAGVQALFASPPAAAATKTTIRPTGEEAEGGRVQ